MDLRRGEESERNMDKRGQTFGLVWHLGMEVTTSLCTNKMWRIKFSIWSNGVAKEWILHNDLFSLFLLGWANHVYGVVTAHHICYAKVCWDAICNVAPTKTCAMVVMVMVAGFVRRVLSIGCTLLCFISYYLQCWYLPRWCTLQLCEKQVTTLGKRRLGEQS